MTHPANAPLQHANATRRGDEMTALPDASHPSSRVAWPAVEPGFAAASVRAMPIDAAARGIARLCRAVARAVRQCVARIGRARDDCEDSDAHDDRHDRGSLDARSEPAPMPRMTTRAATRASASRPTESKRSRLAIRRDRRRASQTAASIDRIASANPSGSSPAPRRAGNMDLQRRSVTILALRAEAGAASDSELSEAAPKHGSLGQPAGGHDMRRALRHGDALAHLIGIVQVVQIAGAVRATANVLVLRPPAGTLFESGIHACPGALQRPLAEAVKLAPAICSTFAAARRRVAGGATHARWRTAAPRVPVRADRADDATAGVDARRMPATPGRAYCPSGRCGSRRAARASAIAKASASASGRRGSGDARDVGGPAASRIAANLLHARPASAGRVTAGAIGIIETKAAGNAGSRQDNHSPSPR
ncbi:hypothetical protein [Burkholderia pseudomallei]|uniref:hypothetical protein n=1 Tax=Burkholderia pseudomallei TaxID=28450 RepID=UPI000572269D|nr:hypothetical protein [Burkholderia pseudomallei]KAA8768603.1 hypothetical protein F5D26_11060 [Burkholderia pseudomallei]OMZ97418.1 hypothetical protein AQ874_07275 [Burkholderia pseudomallei]ONB94451.1 hypothetical protein AQ908_18975 [Burkholderia pseudomallei]